MDTFLLAPPVERQRAVTELTGIIGETDRLMDNALSEGQSEAPTKTLPDQANTIRRDEFPSQTSWEVYNDKAAKADKDFIDSTNESMDVLLVFAGLFSATATAFLQYTLPLLENNSDDRTNDLLTVLKTMHNSSYPLPNEEPFRPSTNSIAVNSLIVSSIAGSLSAAFLSILIKQWTRNYSLGVKEITNQQLRARTRQFRHEGVKYWHFNDIAASLPVIIHVSLLLFAIGVLLFLFPLNGRVGGIPLVIVFVTTLIYFLLSITPLKSKYAPFRSPLTTVLEFIFIKFPAIVTDIFINAVSRVNVASRHTIFEGLQSTLSQSVTQTHKVIDQKLGKESPLARYVHLKWDIDVNVLLGLLNTADRHSERPVLLKCLQDLQTLKLVEEKSPQLFDSVSILDVYSLLAGYCVGRETDPPVLLPGKEEAAKSLCQFLMWMIYLDTTPHRLRNLKKQLPILETESLLLAVSFHGDQNKNLHSKVIGHAAWLALRHLHLSGDPCAECILGTKSRELHDALVPSGREHSRLDGRLIIWYIGCQTRCIMKFALDANTTQALSGILELINRFNLRAPIFHSDWNAFVFSKHTIVDGTSDKPSDGSAWLHAIRGLLSQKDQYTPRPNIPMDRASHRILSSSPSPTSSERGGLDGQIAIEIQPPTPPTSVIDLFEDEIGDIDPQYIKGPSTSTHQSSNRLTLFCQLNMISDTVSQAPHPINSLLLLNPRTPWHLHQASHTPLQEKEALVRFDINISDGHQSPLFTYDLICSQPALVSLFGISHENAFGVSSKHFLDQVTKFLNILGSNSLSQQFIEGKRELFGNYEYVAFRFLDPLEMDDISDLRLELEGSSIIRMCIVFQRISASEAAHYAVEGRGIAESSSFDWSDVIGLLPGSRVRSDKPNKFLDIGIIDCTEN